MATTLEVSYFNTFWVKRLKNFTQYQDRRSDGTIDVESGGTTTGTPNLTTGAGYVNSNVFEDWFIEESRIRGGFNNTSVDFGNKAYIVEEEEKQTRRKNALIYSGVYNAKNGVNNSNQFPIGEDITRSVDPASGSIQKLYAENTNLLILQERKVNRAPIDKDVIFTQEGQPLQANSRLVIGTPSAFEGNFGISRDPGSFAVYGYNKFFTDKDRSVVMQLGPNGLNPISNYGMVDYFRDTLAEGGEIIGAVWLHYTGSVYNNFYGVQYNSSVDFVFNPQPTRTKTFTTINYTGSNGWEVSNIVSDYTGVDANPQQPALGDTTHTDVSSRILSYDEGYYSNSGIQYRAGFDRKQNTYYAAIKNNSNTLAQEVITPGNTVTGIKGQYAVVTFTQDATTDITGAKQLFSVGTTYNNR